MKIRLKAGFFRTKAAELIVADGQVSLTSADGVVVIRSGDLFGFTVRSRGGVASDFEINSSNGTYEGLFVGHISAETLVRDLKQQLGEMVSADPDS